QIASDPQDPLDEASGDAGAPTGPHSLLWRVAGDWRSMLPGTATGVLQLMHPAIGAGVAEHSAFFTDPFDRIYRSIPQIWATIFAPDAEHRGLVIRDVHRTIKGTDDHGRRYHALDPEIFWWAHATFTWSFFRSVELFHPRPLRRAEAEQLYAETVTWYSRYGVSRRPVPPDHSAFVEKFERVCRKTLEMTPAASRAMSYRLADVPGRPLGPPPLGALLTPLVAPAAELLLVGCLPRPVRERFDLVWGPAERAQFRGLAAGLRQGFRLLPRAVNHRTFREAQRRVGARTRARRFRPAA
ncbi:MAG: oxygenase MpaB family protein, partial [Acidimicrobiales bacterium]